MSTTETQRPTRPRFCSDEVIQEMYNIIDDLALYAKDRDSTTVHITVKEAIAVVESALARRRFQLAVRANLEADRLTSSSPGKSPSVLGNLQPVPCTAVERLRFGVCGAVRHCID